MLFKSGFFSWAGGGKNGAVIDMWAAGRFTSPPAEGSPVPDANPPDAGPVTTGIEFGGPGAFTIDNVPSVQDYYVRAQYGNLTIWGFCPEGTLGGVGGTGGGGGDVVSVAVQSANGFEGTVANPTSNAVITLETSATGILKGVGGALETAVAGADYLTPTGNGSGLTAMTVSQIAGAAPLANPGLTGGTTQTANRGDDSTKIATTAYVDRTGGQGGYAWNVKDYGALGNGSHDDTAAFVTAATFAGSFGGMIYVPGSPSPYRINTPSSLVGLFQTTPGIRLKGDETGGSVLLFPAGALTRGTTGRIGDTPVLTIGLPVSTSDPDYVIEDITFEGQGHRSTGATPTCGFDGIYIAGKCKLIRVKVSGFDAGLIMDSPGGHVTMQSVISTQNLYNVMWASNNDDNYFTDCDFNNCAVANFYMDDRMAGINGTAFAQADTLHNVRILSCHMGFGPYGIYQAPLLGDFHGNQFTGKGYFMGSSICDFAKFEKCGNAAMWSDYGTAYPKVSTMTISNAGVLTDTAASFGTLTGHTVTVGTGAMTASCTVATNTGTTITPTAAGWSGFPVNGEEYHVSGSPAVTGPMTIAGTVLTDTSITGAVTNGFEGAGAVANNLVNQRLTVGGGVAWGIITANTTTTITVGAWNGTPQSGMGYSVAGGTSRPHSAFGRYFDNIMEQPSYSQDASDYQIKPGGVATGWNGFSNTSTNFPPSTTYDVFLGQIAYDNFLWNGGHANPDGFGSIFAGSFFPDNVTGRLRVAGATPPTMTVGSGSSGLYIADESAPLLSAVGLTGSTAGARFVGGTTSGAPASGTFVTGDFIVDHSGLIWVCTAGGSPGTWANAGASAGVSSFNARTGAVVPGNADYLAVPTGGLTGATAAVRFVGGTTSGAPVTGTFAKGDFIIGQDASLWVCTTAGSPGTWTQVSGGGGGGSITLVESTDNSVIVTGGSGPTVNLTGAGQPNFGVVTASPQNPTGCEVLYCNTLSNPISVNLPAATGSGNYVTIKNLTTANATTVHPSGSDLIDNGSGTTAANSNITLAALNASGTWRDGSAGRWYKEANA